MLRLDRDALMCDLAETYCIYDMKALPPLTVAGLSCGLRENSRIKMKMRGDVLPFETLLLVAIIDDLRWLRWTKTKDAQKKRNAPKSLLNALLNKEEEQKITAFATAEEFERRRAEILRG